MSPGSGVRFGAVVLFALAVGGFVSPASAQLYGDERRALGLEPDPIARSARLVGMGRLTFVLDDPRNRIELWDFAQNPTGVAEDDTTSTFEIAPITDASSSLHDLVTPGPFRERQNMASREAVFGYEAWHRTRGGAAFGAIGDYGLLRVDQPHDQNLEHRTEFAAPRVMPVINGHVPYMFSERLYYAVRLRYEYQTSNDRLREMVDNAAGQYIDIAGDIVPPSDLFTPVRYSVRTTGGGGGLAFRFGPALTVGAVLDETGRLIKGDNTGSRYTSTTRENRPYGTGQFTAVGTIGPVRYGIDGQEWKANSKASWVYSISSGTASPPLASRGSLYERRENGTSMRGRLMWKLGVFDVGAGGGTFFRKIRIIAPPLSDTTSFNRFLGRAYRQASADTLALPDSVQSDVSQERSWEVGGGIGWTAPDRRLIAGAEFHRTQDLLEANLAGRGPKAQGWDVRAGLEVAANSVLRVRGGYIHRWADRDRFLLNDEYLSNGLTLGLGVSPAKARWSMDAGFVFEWERPDFGDPARPRSNRQELSARIFWPL